ncbi:hypothetical protein EF847_04510 [Actinobacteria bacterium YIM 96077]|uniref:Putative Flp pilus-assembly TadG-like N-terminal domain-containing protein n=1 Tax=Phytoactinopolyspora halophila TaxID=1981511 RepID=A0A329R582_9ACTN|nr:pilus assembly protein TadG-related protein [Phytoactinopolyspora halophila]AYY12083.1 hypothetical protein EF847_04510 [Actinobacteria bacterium YIM 96077]RAW18682.1 hypothetical protein DPM12_01000 [Phytoactinopolyspora halophila]
MSPDDRPPQRTAVAGQESGQITLMILGFVVVLALTVAVVANASHLFLQRRSLTSWADGAVTAAAQSAAHESLYGGTTGSMLPLSEAAARRAVANYIEINDVGDRFDDFAVVHVGVDPPGHRVTVELTASASLIGPDEIIGGRAAVSVTARASARVPFE